MGWDQDGQEIAIGPVQAVRGNAALDVWLDEEEAVKPKGVVVAAVVDKWSVVLERWGRLDEVAMARGIAEIEPVM